MMNHCFYNRLCCFGTFISLPIAGQAYQPANQKNGVTANRTAPAAGGAHTALETYDVVSVGNDIQVVAKSGLVALRKQVKDEYAQ